MRGQLYTSSENSLLLPSKSLKSIAFDAIHYKMLFYLSIKKSISAKKKKKCGIGNASICIILHQYAFSHISQNYILDLIYVSHCCVSIQPLVLCNYVYTKMPCHYLTASRETELHYHAVQCIHSQTLIQSSSHKESGNVHCSVYTNSPSP